MIKALVSSKDVYCNEGGLIEFELPNGVVIFTRLEDYYGGELEVNVVDRLGDLTKLSYKDYHGKRLIWDHPTKNVRIVEIKE